MHFSFRSGSQKLQMGNQVPPSCERQYNQGIIGLRILHTCRDSML